MILRKIINSLCILLAYNSYSQTQFYKEYNSPYQSSRFQFIPTNDTSIYGYLDQNTSVTINKNGQVTGSKKYQYNYTGGYYQGKLAISDTTILCFGTSPLSSNLPFISVFNNKGFVKYNKTYAISGISSIKHVVKNGSSLYHVMMPQSYNLNFQIMKTDLNGNYKSIAKILTSHDNNVTPNSDPKLITINSNQFILTYTYFDSLYFNKNVGIVALDSNLNILWQKSVGDHFEDIPKLIKKYDNNNIYISGITRSYGVGDYDVFVLKIDSAGNIKWFNTFGTIKTDDITALAVDSTNNVVLCGFTDNFDSRSRGIFLKINTSGNLLFSKYYDPLATSKTHLFQDVNVLSDKTIALTGQIYNTITSVYTLGYFKISSFNDGCILKDAAFSQRMYAPLVSQSKFSKTTGTVPTISSVPNPTLTTFTFSNSATACAKNCSVLADFLVNKTVYCVGDTVKLVNKSSNASTYSWKINNSIYSNATHTTIITNTMVPNYTVTLFSYGACTDSTSVLIQQLNNPIASFTKSNQNLYANFKNTSQYLESHKWYFGDGSNSVTCHPAHIYDTLKTYNVCLKAINACGSDSTCQILVAEDHVQSGFLAKYISSQDHYERGYGIAQARNGDIVCAGVAEGYSGSGDKGFRVRVNKLNGTRITHGIDAYNGGTVYHNVISTHDNGLIYTAEIGGYNDVVAKKDSADNRLWAYQMPITKISSIIEAKDSSIYVCGYKLVGCCNEMCVIKLNSLGKIQWYKIFSGGKDGMSIIETREKNILVTGQYFAGNSGYLLKINPKGQIIWSKYYTAPHPINSLSVFETNDHHYLLTGRIISQTPQSYAWAAKMDTSGAPIWAKSYVGQYISTAFGSGFYQNQYNQYFLVMGATTNYYGNSVLRLDNSGNVIWFKNYELSTGPKQSTLHKSIMTHDGGIAICGQTAHNPDPNHDVYAIKIDTAGYNGGCPINLVTYTVSNLPMTANINLLESVTASSYNQISIANSFSGTNLYVFFDSLNCNSNIPTSIDSLQKNSVTSFITIAPNPTENKIKISSSLFISEIVFFDVLGKKVQQLTNLNDLYLEIDLNNYRAGIYYIRTSGRDFSQLSKVMKTE